MRARAVVISITLAAIASCASGPRPGSTAARPSNGASGEDGVTVGVVRVIDGDTIVVAIGAARGTKVRLIGIDTPERDRCMFQTATDRMRALVEGKRVRLIKDVSETDRYGRLLRYVYVGDVFINAVMVRDGFAAAATFPPDVAHAEELLALERSARDAGTGLWTSGTCAP